MGGVELRFRPGIEHLAAPVPACEDAVERQRLQPGVQGLIQILPFLFVEAGVVSKVSRGLRLVLGDQGDEFLPAHGLKGVIEDLLVADRGNGFFAQVLAA